MENNHIPSSPLHRRPSSRPSSSNHQDQPPPVTVESGCLTSSLPRPGITSPPTNTTTIEPFRQNQRDRDRDQSVNVNVGVGVEWSSPWDPQPGMSRHPPAHSSTSSSTPIPDADLASSSLLTSRPLDRSTTSIFDTAGPPSLRKRRRAASLPTPEPIFKRCRSGETPTPSDEWIRTMSPRRRERTRLEHHLEVANRFGRRLFRRRRGEEYISAAKQPPINLTSLRSLDASEILRNPQLRHDLLFDTLAFRPVNSINPTTSAYAEIFTGGARTPSVDPRTNCAIADMYWESIENEITTGCRCTRWKVPSDRSTVSMSGMQAGHALRRNGKALEHKQRVMGCICGGWMDELSEAEWWRQSKAWPSRLPEMIRTLREVLTSLMGSTTPCPNHFAHSVTREALEAHERTCPTVTHALVPELCAALDPEFITSQVRHGVYDFRRVFDVLGEAMKVHCAPVRDAMVDDMIRIARSGDVCVALRRCFDCVEVMKLDIANHQVHALRPYLWTSASQYEYSAFEATLAAQSRNIATSHTRHWIREASSRVLSKASPRERLHLIGKCKCGDNEELVFRSLAEGFMDLVCADWPSAVWPPVLQRRLVSQAGVIHVESVSGGVEVPEVFKMDARRIKNFNAEMIDMAITALVLVTYKNVLLRTHPNVHFTPATLRAHTDTVRSDLEHFQAAGSITCPQVIADLSLRLATRVHAISSHGQTQAFTSIPTWTSSHIAAVEATSQTFQHILTHSLRPDSAAITSMMRSLRVAVTAMLTNTLLGFRLQEGGPLFSPSSFADGKGVYPACLDCDRTGTGIDSSLQRQLSNPSDHDVQTYGQPLHEVDMAAEDVASAEGSSYEAMGIDFSDEMRDLSTCWSTANIQHEEGGEVDQGPQCIDADMEDEDDEEEDSEIEEEEEYEDPMNLDTASHSHSHSHSHLATLRQLRTTFLRESYEAEQVLLRNMGIDTYDPDMDDGTGFTAAMAIVRGTTVATGQVQGQVPQISGPRQQDEIREMISRMSRIVAFNLGVFKGVYGGRGMCVGS